MPIDKSSAQEVLDPILAILEKCIEDGWDDWRTFYGPKHHILDPRARAAIVYCHIVARARELFRNVPGVEVGRKQGVFRLFIGDDIALRFKKAKKNGTTSNVSTLQQRLIDLQMTIPGILPGTMLNAVYQLDDLQRDISRMLVTHQLEGKIQWTIAIGAAKTTPMVMAEPPATVNAPRARVKGSGLAKSVSNSGS